ncbi:hypothetical protein QAD02_017528 [Eretmocerus hayati]|uniref:Uncharacterized protein n=1 Tax=Eretmocerus hayati TaxID=131215 RepID=A0ACC2PFE0_9HYME|nr:hypothetical protein QAD02_017528 [Eretmocerus hayati]
MWNRKVFLRIIELVLCIACAVALRITDDETRRVWHYLRNRSREWSLLPKVTWGVIGDAVATATCGGYVVVTAGLLIAAASGELRGRKTEKFLLGLGIILFSIIGGLALFSIDSVPDALVDNAIIFGSLCLAVVAFFILDFLMSNPASAKKMHGGTQTPASKDQGPKQYVTTTTMTINSEKEPPNSRGLNGTTWVSPPTPEMQEKRHSASTAQEDDHPDQMMHSGMRDHQSHVQHPSSQQHQEERNFLRSERQYAERQYTHNNGDVTDSPPHRGSSYRTSKHHVSRDRDDSPKRMNGNYYRGDDVYQRPIDEVDDVPPFPVNGDLFPRVVNPSVKIMRVDRDEDRGYDNRGYDSYRYSDSSQYDNVPTRLRGSSSLAAGTSRKQREGRDEIEQLEGYLDALKTSTTSTRIVGPGTATSTTTKPQQRYTSSNDNDRLNGTGRLEGRKIVTPSEPGFVRHTASNWPHNAKPKTPSPE